MLQIIPVINNKGGVGKTTTSVNLAAGLARQGRRVLLVDLDSQASASHALGIGRGDLNPSIASVLFNGLPINEAVRETSEPGLDLITASTDLSGAELRLNAHPARVTHLARTLLPLRAAYDYIVLDCAPATSLLNVNALVAADAVVIPCSPSFLSVSGLISFGEVIRQVRAGVGAAAPILGIAMTLADVARSDVQETLAALRRHYGGKLFTTTIRPDPALEKAPLHGQSIFAFDGDSTGAADYADLVREFVERAARYDGVYSTLGAKAKVNLDAVREDAVPV